MVTTAVLTGTIGLAALALLCFFGLPVLALLPGSVRYRLLPGLPVFGVIFLVVVSHALTWAFPLSVTSWIAVGLALGLTAIGWWRNPVRWRSVRMVLPAGLAVAVVGAIGAVLSWIPLFLVRSHLLIQPSSSLDAVWYVAASTWLKDHTLFQVPQIGTGPSNGLDSILYGPAVEAADNVTRLGQEMVMGTISTITGIDLVAGFSSWLGIWVFLSASAAWVFGEMFRLSARARLAVALLLSVSSPLIYQVLAQNASSILGIALVVACLGAVGSALNRGGRRSVPLWLAAVSIAAVLGVYSEFLPFLAVALAAITLIAPRQDVLRRLTTAMLIVVISFVLAPVAWVRAIGATLFVGGIAAKGGGETDAGAAVFSLLGPLSTMIDESKGAMQSLTIVGAVWVALAALVGIIAGLVSGRTRGLTVGAGLGSLALASYLIFSANAYVGHRAVDMITPLVTLSAAAGWIEIARRSRRFSRPARTVVVVVTIVALVGTVAVNFSRSAYGVSRHVWSERAVTEEFSHAAGWVDSRATPSGDDVTVAVATLWEQLWLSEALVKHPDVAWVNLRGDMGYRANLKLTRFWDGEIDRFVLVGPGAFESPDVAPIDSDGRFNFVDWTTTSGVVVVPDSTNGTWDYGVLDGIANEDWPAGLRVIAGSNGGDYALSVDLLEPNTEVRVRIDGTEVQVPVSSTGTATIPFTIPSTSTMEIEVMSPIGFRLTGVDVAQEAR